MTLEQKNIVLTLVPGVKNKVFTLSEFAEGVKEIEALIDQAEKIRLNLAEKRRKYFEKKRALN